MEVFFYPQPGDPLAMLLQVLWGGKIVHAEIFQERRALSVARLFIADGYPVTWITKQGSRITPHVI